MDPTTQPLLWSRVLDKLSILIHIGSRFPQVQRHIAGRTLRSGSNVVAPAPAAFRTRRSGTPCGRRQVERDIPRTTFYARDLDPKISERTRAVCEAAGVKGAALLDACTLDVAVIGNDAAAQVFLRAAQPVAVGNVLAATSGTGGWVLRKWWPWLILIVILLLVFLVLKRRRS